MLATVTTTTGETNPEPVARLLREQKGQEVRISGPDQLSRKT